MWTAERILALAPDPGSAKAGQGLASPRKWVSTGQDDRAMWGECQGSGSKPYQTQIDLSKPAFKCTCPSRKFPCKHALGLFLMLGPQPGTAKAEPPAWVTEWLSGRGEKAAKKKEKLEKAAEEPVDTEAVAKRTAARMDKITAGAADLQTWLEDLVRQGLAAAQSAGPRHFESIAARMVDAQAPGLARLVREMGEAAGRTRYDKSEWHVDVLAQAGRVYLILQALARIEQLPAELQADVRTAVGVPVKEEELAPLAGMSDAWHVIGQSIEEEEKLKTQRTWLIGEKSGRGAMILEFSYGGQPLKSTLMSGMRFEAELVFYSSAWPMRAIIRNRSGDAKESKGVPGYATITAALAAYSDALATVPWIERFPMALSQVRVMRIEGIGMRVVDSDGRWIPLRPRKEALEIMALSGGHAVGVFGEWDGHVLTPMSLWRNETGEGLHGVG